MAGLLDVLNSDEGRMALGLLSAAGPSATPMSFGQRLQGAMGQFQAQKAAEDERKQKAQFMQMQMADMQAQQQQREAQAKALQQAAMRQQAFQGALSGGSRVGAGEAMAQGGGPTPQAALMLGQSKPMDWNALSMQFPDQIELIKKLSEAQNFGRNKVAHVEDTMVNGRPVKQQLDDYGGVVGGALPQWKEPKQVDTGGQVGFMDPVTLKMVSQFQKTNTPDAVLGANTTMRGQNMTNDRARDANAIASTGKLTENEDKLRKEFEGLPEVKNYKQAFPAYAAIVDASKRSSPMADINLVYGIAKLYDPNSVVREGEYATVANSPNIPERVKGWAQYLAGGGKLTQQVKDQIVSEAQGRIGTFEGEYNKSRGSYTQIAKRNMLRPENVFSDVGNAVNGAAPKPAKTVVRTGTDASGKKVVQYSDGSIEHAN